MKTKRQIAIDAYQESLLSKVTTFFEIALTIVILACSTLGWFWMDWSLIWRVDLSAFWLLIITVLIDFFMVKITMHFLKDELEEKAKNQEPSSGGYSGAFKDRLQKLADKEGGNG